MEKKAVFEWSVGFDRQDLIDKVVRIDIAFSKGLNGHLTFYDSEKYCAKEEYNKDNDKIADAISSAWDAYDKTLEEYSGEGKAPVDYLTNKEDADEEGKKRKKKRFYSFSLSNLGNGAIGVIVDSGSAIKPESFEYEQGKFSRMVFENTKNSPKNIKQILVFPSFIQNSFGSNCIVTLSDTLTNTDDIFVLMAECVGFSYEKSLNKFSSLLERESNKSAKAAIISRNLSHNLGSHVMFYIKQKLESVEKIMETGALKELINSQSVDEMKKKIENKIALGNEIEMPFLVGLGRFLNYLQERQDFIATVATNYIPYSTIINFKDAIYDELKPEMRYERHKSPETKGKKPANLLLDYIAYSEGFTSSEDIELWFGKGFYGKGKPENVPQSLREFNVALPGGNMGRQAFFSIMENIIRNTAKHDGSLARDGKLKFQFDLLNAEEIQSIDGYSLRQKDKKGQKLDPTCYQNFKNDFSYLGISVLLNAEVSNNTLNKLNEGFQWDYIMDDFQMDENCKGLKEIRISAAWIRGKELEYDIPSDEPPAVAIRKTEGHLQYIICLPKPKRVAFVSIVDDDQDKDKDKDKEIDANDKDRNSVLDENGCQVFKLPSHEIAKNKIADFDLIVCSGVDYNKVRPYVGSRIIYTDDLSLGSEGYEKSRTEFVQWKKEVGKLEEILTKKETGSEESEVLRQQLEALKANNPVEKFISSLYLHWLKQEFPEDDKVKVSVCDVKAEKNSPETSPYVTDKIVHCDQSSDLDYYQDRILFSTHYTGQVDVIEEAKKKNNDINEETCGQFPHARFVEGISGGNSTDRLIRHDKRDASWYCRHMVAGLSKVAIFDERLYGMIMPEYEPDIRNSVKNYLSDKSQISAYDFVKGIELNGNKKLNYDETKLALNNLKQSTVLDEEVCVNSLSFLSPDYSTTWQFREKGIWAFNIRVIRNVGDFDNVEIVGYSAIPSKAEIGYYSEYFRETVIAHIKRKGEEIKVEPTKDALNSDGTFKYRFDFISIHQGLLDKIYGALKNKNDELDKVNKVLVTKALFDIFYFKSESEANYKDGYLPHFVIHSGRSKPNAKDMPQHLPFLQFSAIDHAVRDCKHTLTELLYSAHYEQ